MLEYKQQEAAFFRLINILNEYSFDSDIDAKISQWDPRTGVAGFPNKYSFYMKYNNIPKSNISLIFYLDQKGQWSSVEIMNMDIAPEYQKKGLGRRLINHTINLAKKIGANSIYGDVLDKENYSSAGFYEKCGFNIRESSGPRILYMSING